MSAWTAHYIMLWSVFLALAFNMRRFRSRREAEICMGGAMLCGCTLIGMLVFGGPS